MQDSAINEAGCVELGLACAGVCQTLHQGMNKSQTDQLKPILLKAIEQLGT